VLQNTVRASLELGLVGRLDRGVTVGCSAGRVDSVQFVHVKGLAHLLADKTFVCEVPTVEITVPIGFVWVDILHGGLGEGCNRVGGTPSGLVRELPVAHARPHGWRS
jgi:hypothetical protein